jgi:hypothetical protein
MSAMSAKVASSACGLGTLTSLQPLPFHRAVIGQRVYEPVDPTAQALVGEVASTSFSIP